MLSWVVGSAQISDIAGINPSLSQHFFDTTTTYVQGLPVNDAVPSGWVSNPAGFFTSLATFQSAAGTPAINANAKAAIYDIESWPSTPPTEQQAPLTSMQTFCQVAHTYKLRCILAPGLDLMDVLKVNGTLFKQPGETAEHAYIRYGMATAATYADVYVIQAQSDELTVSTYQSFVQQAAAQANAANPGATVLSELGATIPPSGTIATEAQLDAAFQATIGSVSGYWLSIPSGAPSSPAADFLTTIHANGY